MIDNIQNIAKKLVIEGKGILAADESTIQNLKCHRPPIAEYFRKLTAQSNVFPKKRYIYSTVECNTFQHAQCCSSDLRQPSKQSTHLKTIVELIVVQLIGQLARARSMFFLGPKKVTCPRPRV